MLAAAFGPAYAYLALRLAYGRGWSESGAPAALALYSPYICLLAVNGVLEAFQHAVATPAQLGASNAWLVGFSAAHVALSVGLVGRLGARGLIAADAGNMALRIAYSLWFVARHGGGPGGPGGLAGLFPGPRALGAYLLAFAATTASNVALLGGPGQLVDGCGAACTRRGFWGYAGAHVTLGAAVLVSVVAVVYRTERQLWNDLRSVRQKQQ